MGGGRPSFASRFIALLAALPVSLAVTSCDGGGESGADGGFGDGNTAMDADFEPPPPGSTGLPCDVEQVVGRNCLRCHRDPPRFGAPMPLVTWEDTQAEAVTEPTRPVWELMQVRINDEHNPMPPRGDMSDADRVALNAWLDEGAPMRAGGGSCEAGDAGTSDAGLVDPGVGPDELPCEPTHELRAFGDAEGGKFHVPEGAGNHYECFAFEAPWEEGEQATAWAPIVDDDRVLHHYILYETQEPQDTGTSFPCEALPTSDARFLMGWAPGTTNFVMPDDVGLQLDPDSHLLLQVHYWNVAGHTDANDASGLAVCTTDTPREQAAGVLTMGTLDIDVPPRSSDVEISYTCPERVFDFLGEFTVLSSSPHMHEMGTKFRTEVLREDGSMDVLADVDPWDFDDQTSYPQRPPLTIGPGDEVKVTCTYDNPTDSRITYGERTEDEMCFDFMLVYPITKWPDEYPPYCVDIERFGF